MRDFAKQFYQSRPWKDTRRSFLWHVNGLCSRCLSRGQTTPAKIVHHIVELTPENIGDTAITLGFQNLMAVCADCHGKQHSTKAEKARYTFDAQGRCVPR